jgi:hypothetical protein
VEPSLIENSREIGLDVGNSTNTTNRIQDDVWLNVI